MKTTFILCISLVMNLVLCVALQAQSIKSARYNIIPYPALLKPADGVFMVNDKTAIYLAGKGVIFKKEAGLLQQILAQVGKNVLIDSTFRQRNVITLAFDSTLTDDEAYTMKITPSATVINAKSPAGMFYAIETFGQLLLVAPLAKDSILTVPAVMIDDKPAFKWRGMMVDVARAFFSIGYLQKVVDMMATYKLNKLHLHLTDDQGWRIEIKKYPALALSGGWREFNEMDSAALREYSKTGNPDFIIDEKHLRHQDGKLWFGGFYTQDEMAAFIRYAAERHIEVIPEVDMPGHMMSATRIFPSLTCDGNTGEMHGFSPPACPCKEDLISFAKDIFSEIAALFPSVYIHIGGDEVDQKYWEQSPLCETFMRDNHLTSVHQIQGYFNDRMKDFFKLKGKILVGWDEIAEGGIDSSAVVMYWRPWAPAALSKAIKNNNRVILSPDGPLYFDAIPDRNTLSTVYHYNPFDTAYHFTDRDKKIIMGVQGNLWGELLPSEQRADYMLMPRLTALSEVGWTNKPSYPSYLSRLETQYTLWDKLNINYRLPDPDDIVENNVFVQQASFFKVPPSANFVLRYTTDNSQPVNSSPIMRQAVKITQRTDLKLALFTRNGRRGDVYSVHFKSASFQKTTVAGIDKPGLQYELYIGQFNKTRELKGTPDSSFTAVTIGIPDWLKKPAFGLRLKGFIQVPKTGIYTFYLNTDDGGILQLDGAKLIEDEGPHGEKEVAAQAALQKGMHPLALDYIQGGGGFSLSLRYSIEGSPSKPVPESWLFYSQN